MPCRGWQRRAQSGQRIAEVLRKKPCTGETRRVEMVRRDRCTDPMVGHFLLAYELDALTQAQVDLFERHLLACEHCRGEVVSFSPAASELRRTGLPLVRAARSRARSRSRTPAFRWLWKPAAVSVAALAAILFLRSSLWGPAHKPLPQQSITFALNVPAESVTNPDPARSGFRLSAVEGREGRGVFRFDLSAGHGSS